MSQWKIFGPPTVWAPVPGIYSGTQGYFSINGFGPLTLDIPNGGGTGALVQGGSASVLFSQTGSYIAGNSDRGSGPQVYRVTGVNSGAAGWMPGDYAVVVLTSPTAKRDANENAFYGFASGWPITYGGLRGEPLDNVYTAIKVMPVTQPADPGQPAGQTSNPGQGQGYGQSGYGSYGYQQQPQQYYIPSPGGGSFLSRIDPNLLLLGAGWLLNSTNQRAAAREESDRRQAQLDAQLFAQQLQEDREARRDDRDYRLALLNQFSNNPRLAQNVDPALLELLQAQGG